MEPVQRQKQCCSTPLAKLHPLDSRHPGPASLCWVPSPNQRISRTPFAVEPAPMTIEMRRRVYEKVSARLKASGTPFDDDPRFLSAVEEWIEGAIDIAELRRRYSDIQRTRTRLSSDHGAD